MSRTHHFELGKLRDVSQFPGAVWHKMHEVLFTQEEVAFSIGDILLKNDLFSTFNCMRLLPEDHLRRILRRIVLPALDRVIYLNEDVRVKECRDMVHQFSVKQQISVDLLETKARELLLSETSTPEQRLAVEAVFNASRSLWDKNQTSINSAIDAMIVILALDPYVQSTVDQVKLNILKTYPPMFVKYNSEYVEVFFKEAMLRYKPNWFQTLLGFKKKDGRTYYFKWGNWSPGWGLEFEVTEFSTREGSEREYSWFLQLLFIYGKFWINLPWLPQRNFSKNGVEDNIRWWGFSTGDNTINTMTFHWGRKSKYVQMPWCPTHVRTEYLMKDGTWRDRPDWRAHEDVRELFEHDIATETHSFRYVLRSGEVQHRLATINVVESEWRWRWFKKLPITRHITRSIDIEFSDEVGERSGSWKGGCIRCGETMKLNELPSETLKRLEHNRTFR
jgi:hypothetical protein